MNTGRFFVVNTVIALAVGIAGTLVVRGVYKSRGRERLVREMGDMRMIATGLDAYFAEHKEFPRVDTIEGLTEALSPYIRRLPTRDTWDNAFQIRASATGYTLYSLGKDGLGSNCAPGTTTRLEDEICIVNGRFVRTPKFD